MIRNTKMLGVSCFVVYSNDPYAMVLLDAMHDKLMSDLVTIKEDSIEIADKVAICAEIQKIRLEVR